MSPQQRRVVIVQQSIPPYRVPVFEGLRHRLDQSGVALDVLYSDRYDAVRAMPTAASDWMCRVNARELRVGDRRALWQAILGPSRGADLLVLEAALHLLANHVVLARRRFGGCRIAAWGQGSNTRRPEMPWQGSVRSFLARQMDWWFAYNDLSAKRIAAMGFPGTRITSVNNAIDTSLLVQERARLGEDAVAKVRAALGLGVGPVGIFCGGLYPERRIEFLADVCRAVRRSVGTFELIILGDGVDRHRAERFDAEEDWVHYVGPQLGADRVAYFACADITLMPGAVGLGVLDAFALECPPIAAQLPNHGPEIAYLRHEENGLLAADSPDAFANAVIRTLSDGRLRDRLVRGCEATARQYDLGSMVERFVTGIKLALASSPQRG